MATPTQKDPEINKLINAFSGDNREEAIEADRCIKPPVGCGKSATKFRDALSAKEFLISGLCQECQDSIFGGD